MLRVLTVGTYGRLQVNLCAGNTRRSPIASFRVAPTPENPRVENGLVSRWESDSTSSETLLHRRKSPRGSETGFADSHAYITARSHLPADSRQDSELQASQIHGRAYEDDSRPREIAASATPEKEDKPVLQASSDPNVFTEEEVQALIKDSPFLDLSSPLTAYEWFKLVIGFPVFILKLLLAAVGLPFVWLVVRLLTVNTPLNQPLAPWRNNLLRPFVKFWAGVLVRIGFNFYAPRVKGYKNVKKAEACRAIIVFNHVSYTDGIILGSILAPSGLAKASVADIPFFGVFTKALQFLFVARKGTLDAGSAVAARNNTSRIAERAADPRYPLFIVAPEGTTKHGNCLLRFSTGAFVSGAPVLPVLLKYRNKRFNMGWGIVYTMFHLLRLACQFQNYLEVEILEPYMPSAEEKANPRLYAENVRKLMAEKLGATLSPCGIAEQQALKRAGVYVDWTGRRILRRPPKHLKKVAPVGSPLQMTTP
ncbi:hypothetical protein WJX72_003052 [[Myrmecia] bisecta]|uniref:Phospholipid/glycerol acyltransferase domain-containing protein n=1 Tax=[Myrmecia] bisecta TaxID=41462 RepID=A0AAW1R4P8_9CHLO